jgi:hypothetical protein
VKNKATDRNATLIQIIKRYGVIFLMSE